MNTTIWGHDIHICEIEEWDEDDDYNSMIIAHLGWRIDWDEQKNFQHFLNKELRFVRWII